MVKARSRRELVKVKAMSRPVQDKVGEVHGKVKARSRRELVKVKARSRRGQGKVERQGQQQ